MLRQLRLLSRRGQAATLPPPAPLVGEPMLELVQDLVQGEQVTGPAPYELEMLTHGTRDLQLLAAAASDHLPVKAIVATQNLRWDAAVEFLQWWLWTLGILACVPKHQGDRPSLPA